MNYRLVTLTFVAEKTEEHLILEIISKCTGDNNVIGSYQHGFTKGRSYLTDLMAFCD